MPVQTRNQINKLLNNLPLQIQVNIQVKKEKNNVKDNTQQMVTRSQTNTMKLRNNNNVVVDGDIPVGNDEESFISYVEPSIYMFHNLPKKINKIEKVRILFELMDYINEYFPKILRITFPKSLKWRKFAYTVYNKSYEFSYIQTYENFNQSDLNYIIDFIKFNKKLQMNLLSLFEELKIYPKFTNNNVSSRKFINTYDMGMILIDNSL